MYWSNTTKSKCLATISEAQAKAIGVYNRRSPSSQSKEITTSPSRQIHGPIGPVNISLSSSHIRCLPYLASRGIISQNLNSRCATLHNEKITFATQPSPRPYRERCGPLPDFPHQTA